MIAGCDSGSKNRQQPQPELKFEPFDPSVLNVERVEIPIDAGSAGGEASLDRNFYFIFDGSGSMSAPPMGACKGEQNFESKLDGAKWAIKEFLKQAPDDISLGLYVFDGVGQREVEPLAKNNRKAFLTAVDRISAGGGTPLAKAIEFGADKLVAKYKKQLGYGEFRLVVVTDGLAEKIPDSVKYASKYGMPIYAIGLCIEEEHPLRRYAASYRAADSFQDLAKGLEETLAELPSFDPTEFE